MPLYTYLCDCGEKFDEIRSVSDRAHSLCPKCGFAAPLTIDGAPALDYQKMAMDNGFPTAVSRWEKDHKRRAISK
jgi:putative FmdB family regulatory protein